MECLNNLINHPISIHAPREGCDRKAFKSISKAKHFNPRTPRGVRQGPSGRCSRDSDNFNPRTPRGVRPRPPPSLCHSQSISIHAPREGCDHGKFEAYAYINDFNPRTPRGVRHMLRGGGTGPHGFQSTHPARGATGGRCTDAIPSVYFNPRTPRGVRPHIPCSPIPSRGFQSTHPARGATSSPCRFRTAHKISIHAPREGCDLGARGRAYAQAISIHAPREGCDSKLYQRAESLLGSICLFAQGEEG